MDDIQDTAAAATSTASAGIYGSHPSHNPAASSTPSSSSSGYTSPHSSAAAAQSSPISSTRKTRKVVDSRSMSFRLHSLVRRCDNDEARVSNIPGRDVRPGDITDPRGKVAAYVDVEVISEGKTIPPYLTCVLLVTKIYTRPFDDGRSSLGGLSENMYINSLFWPKSCRDRTRSLARGNTLRIYDPVFLPDVAFPVDDDTAGLIEEFQNRPSLPTLICTHLMENSRGLDTPMDDT